MLITDFYHNMPIGEKKNVLNKVDWSFLEKTKC